jgi:hypothetical protein
MMTMKLIYRSTLLQFFLMDESKNRCRVTCVFVMKPNELMHYMGDMEIDAADFL